MQSFTTITLGCKVNQYETTSISQSLAQLGLLAEDKNSYQKPDLVVINTCCVTATAMHKSRQAIRRALRRWPGAALLITGCYCDYDAPRLVELLTGFQPPPQRVFIAGHQGDLTACLEQIGLLAVAGQTSAGSRAGPFSQDNLVENSLACPPADTFIIRPTPDHQVKSTVRAAAGTQLDHFPDHQRAFVKIQDGCDAGCTYCVVRLVRRSIWSRPADQVVQECRRLVARGHREIVLCGISLGAYGRDTTLRCKWTGPSPLAGLIRQVAKIDGLWRLRLSSIEPADLDDRLLETCLDTPNLAPHFHIPVQSGSDRILRRMNRQYSTEQVCKLTDRLKNAFDRPAITTDIIVGFAGEGEEDFSASLELARRVVFSKIHAFPFSPMPGTAAWGWRAQMPPPAEVRARLARLVEVEKQLADEYAGSFIGNTLSALVEKVLAPNGSNLRVAKAMSDRYLSISFPAGSAKPGQVVSLKILSRDDRGLVGTLIDY